MTVTAIITESDFKCEYLFRMCSVVTNLVTSLEFKPIRCAFMLCHLGQTGNGYVVTRFRLLSSTAESGATSGYVVVPERFGQNEARAGRNVERTRRKSRLSHIEYRSKRLTSNKLCSPAQKKTKLVGDSLKVNKENQCSHT